jgi:hypothetical protein
MSSVIIAGDTSGTVTLAAPAVAGSGVLTLPVATDTLVGKATTDTLTNKTLTSPTITGATITVASTTAPAFFAYQNSAQTISSTTLTKVTLDTELFDTNSNFASSRFTPTVAGYYQISATIAVGATTTGGGAYIYKNGAIYSSSYQGSMNSSSVSTVIYLNGSTDYVELYVYFAVGQVMGVSAQQTCMSGAMVRSA